ncbi:hypothetical protein C8F04DRAFT_1263589 [Mycena alexandri]|uniref:Uncharacterized protein n=1 Tax=Mycena alexandri TaxID=1745969 RepID=A0AAD6SPD6_9AGAR|nr:hypothetical protein C8F04DRAFT_1263589 [Mycena alexandri]
MTRSNNAIPSTASKPTRKRVRRTGKKPGKVSWVHGTKLKFFSTRSEEWMSAQRMGTTQLGTFYDNITNLYIQKYGYDLKDDEDLEVDVEDPTDPNAPDPDKGSLTQEEADRRTKISSTIRGRIGSWYRSHYGGGVEQGQKNLFKDLFSAGANIGAVQPAKMQTWQYYSKLHYDERVKARFEVAWKSEVQRAKDLDLPAPHEVKVRGNVTRQAWEEESAEFKAVVVAAQNKEHAQTLRAWEMGRAEESSHTAEELHATLKNAGLYLQPLADTIRERFSMNVAIMLCGPIGELGGAIGVRSVHSGTTAGLNPKKWYNVDPVGYQNAEASMVRFLEKTFNEEERTRRRAQGRQAQARDRRAQAQTQVWARDRRAEAQMRDRRAEAQVRDRRVEAQVRDRRVEAQVRDRRAEAQVRARDHRSKVQVRNRQSKAEAEAQVRSQARHTHPGKGCKLATPLRRTGHWWRDRHQRRR